VRSDYLSIVEAAYEPAQDLDAWLGNVLRCARGTLDRGIGVIAHRFQHAPDEFRKSQWLVEGGVPALRPESLERVIDQLVVRFEPRTFRDIYPLAPVATWASKNCSSVFWDASMLGLIETGATRWYDVLGVIAGDPSGHGCILFAPDPKPRHLGTREMAFLQRIAAHLATGYRLARARATKPDAVLDPDGKLLHRESGVGAQEARDLGAATQAIDRARGRLRRVEPERALELWKGLVAGRWSLVDQIDHDGRRFVVAKRNTIEHRAWESLTTREAQVLACAAEGQSLKIIGYQLGISTSTAATDLAHARRKLRFASRLDLVAAYRGRRWGAGLS
jgi:DNA-binding CsgD family transcriptional regulator